MFAPAWIISAALACVLRAGEGVSTQPEPLPPPDDFADVEQRLDDLLASPQDIDQRDRLRGAADLARAMKTADADAQRTALRYLRHIVEIEERSRLVDIPIADGGPDLMAFVPMGTPIVEEVLGGPAVAASVPLGPPDITLAAEREAAGDLTGALAAVAACEAAACSPEQVAVFARLRDNWLNQQREAAGALFSASREASDPVRRLADLRSARAMLADAIDRFPESAIVADLRRSVELVQAEIELALQPTVVAPAVPVASDPLPTAPVPAVP
jgi:hypothetical protein